MAVRVEMRGQKATRDPRRSGGPTPRPEREARDLTKRRQPQQPRACTSVTTLPTATDRGSPPVPSAVKKKKRLVRAMRFEVAKPLGTTWDEAGTMLRALRAISHRLVNAATFECIEAARYDSKSNVTTAVRDEEGAIRDYYTERVTKLEGERDAMVAGKERRPSKRARERGATVEPTVHDEESAAKAKRGIERQLAVAQLLAAGELPSAIVDACARRGFQAAKKYWKARGSERLPSMKFGAPIFVRDGQWELRETERGIEFGLRLTGGRTGKTWFALLPFRGAQWGTLREMAAGHTDYKLGDAKLIYDDGKRARDRKGKWYAVLTYSTALPAPASGSGTMVVHRGMHNFLYHFTEDGHAGPLMRGNKLRHQKEQLEARHRGARLKPCEMGQGEQLGGAALGHGRKRRFGCYDAVGDKIDRVVKTACQQTAAHAVRVARERGCSRILIEDYGGIDAAETRGERRFVSRFPFHQLKESIEWACQKAGMVLHETPSAYISTTCPRCGAVSAKAHNRRTGTFHCGCGFERSADWVAAFHMLRMGGGDMTVWTKRLAVLRAVADAAQDASGSD